MVIPVADPLAQNIFVKTKRMPHLCKDTIFCIQKVLKTL